MSILIGGSGSSGSTLLRTLLNRHPEVFSGDELSVFNKHLAYYDWRKFCSSLDKNLTRSCCTDGWFPFPEINFLDVEYGWESEELRFEIDRSRSLLDFTQTFFRKPLEKYEKSIWIEKTPSNAYCFPLFLEQFSGSKVIHIVRNPYDSIASLVKRGFTTYFAVGVWYINNAFALRLEGDDRYLRIRYEDLCDETDTTMSIVSDFIGVENFVFSKPPGSESIMKNDISSWDNSPRGAISKSSIGGFKKLAEDEKALIKYIARVFFISPDYRKRHGLTHMSFGDLTSHFGYQNLSGGEDNTMLFKAYKGYLRDRVSRIKNEYPNAFANYPAGLRLVEGF